MSSTSTINLRINNAKQLIESLQEPANTGYYLVIGKPSVWDDDNSPPEIANTVIDSEIEPYREWIYAKKISSADVSHVIERVTWQSGQVYNQYSDSSISLYSGDSYYVITDDNNVYKCLYNNNDAPSTVKPTTISVLPFTLSDGYTWKYMYTIDGVSLTKFATSGYIPVKTLGDDYTATINTTSIHIQVGASIAVNSSIYGTIDAITINGSNTIVVIDPISGTFSNNSNVTITSASGNTTGKIVSLATSDDGSNQYDVEQAAVNGAIEIIDVTSTGIGYNAYTNGVFVTVTNSTVLVLASTANTVNGIYTNSSLYVSSGLGVGQVREISNYNGSTKTVTLSSALTVLPNTTSQYIISPTVRIDGDGSNAVAVASVDVNSNTVINVYMITTGSNYSFANVSVYANTQHGTDAAARALISPRGGHGKDPVYELGGDNVMFNTRLVGNDSGNIPTDFKYRQVFLVKDPVFANGMPATQDSNTYVNLMTRLAITKANATAYQQYEEVVGLSSNASGTIVIGNNSLLQLTGTNGTFTNNEVIVGQTSNATATIQTITNPDFRKFSGEVLYVQNFSPVTRATDKTEDIKIIQRM